MTDNQSGAEGLAAKTVKGSAYSIGASAVTMVLGFGRSILMARLLAPEDFGVVAFALTFLNFTIPVRDFGLDQALIHRKFDEVLSADETLAVHFSLRLLLIALFSLLLLAATPALRHFYPQKQMLVPVLLGLTVGELARALGSTPITYLRKQMDFRELATLQILTSFTMTTVGPVLAWQGWGVWAIVGAQVAGVIAETFTVWTVIRPWRPRWSLDWDLVKWFLGYGRFIFISRLLSPVTDQFDEFWIGTSLGSLPLGYYTKAYELARYSRRVISDPVSKVFFSTFAKAQDDRLRLSKAFFRVASLTVRVGFLVIGAFILAANEFVRLFLGAKWLPMVLPLQLMVVYALLSPLSAISSNLINAVGQPAWNTRKRITQVIFFIPAVILGSRWGGINGVALATDAMLFIGLVIVLSRVRLLVDLSLRRMLLVPLVALLTGAGISLLLASRTVDSTPWRMVAKIGSYTACYTLVLLISERKEYVGHLHAVYGLLLGRGLRYENNGGTQ